MKILTVLILTLLSVKSIAQQDTTYFNALNMDAYGPKNAKYFELNSGKNRNGRIEQFYLSEELYGNVNYRYNQLDGPYQMFYKNGNFKEKGSYKSNRKSGLQKVYYQNGQERAFYQHNPNASTIQTKIVNAYDSLGNPQVQKGDGLYEQTNNQKVLEKGHYEEGVKVGTWIGMKNNLLYYEEEYIKGGLKSGTSYDSEGNSYDYDQFEMHASFPGGMNKWNSFLRKNLDYPSAATKNKIEGVVFLSFVVGKDGIVEDIQVLDSPDKLLSDEAVIVLKKSYQWEPGTQRGQPVKSRMQLRITFRLK